VEKRLSRWVTLLMCAGVAAIAVRVLFMTLPPLHSYLRMRVALLRSRPVVDDYIRRHQVRKLQLGAGNNSLHGWLNTDVEPGPGQAFLDVTKPFPVPDRTFHYVTSEHLLEHLSYEEGRAMLRECYRILRPGGKVRIATPNLLRFLELFRQDKTEEARRYVEQKLRWHGWPEVQTPECMILNLEFSSFGHKFLYDPGTLRATLATAGFQRAREFEPGESDDPVLRGVEFRHTGPWREANTFETMVVEAVRP